MANKILLIEDEDFIRDLYVRQFTKAGYTIEGFANGKDGLAAALQNTYDLLLLDIMLPDLNGMEILKQVKKSEAKKNMPVVMLTNLGQDDIIKEGFKIGADGYLIKASFTPDQIVQEVTNILNQQQVKQQAAAQNAQNQPVPQKPQPSQMTQFPPTQTPIMSQPSTPLIVPSEPTKA